MSRVGTSGTIFPSKVRVSQKRPVAESNPAVAHNGRACRTAQSRRRAALSFNAFTDTSKSNHRHEPTTDPGLLLRFPDRVADGLHRVLVARAANRRRQG